MAVAVTLACWLGLQTKAFTGFRLRATDTYFPSQSTDADVMVLGIDGPALSAAGASWPWPRDLQAAVLERVIAAGARLVVADVIYNPATPNDERLAQVVASGNVVVAEAGEVSRTAGRRLLQARATTSPVPVIAAAAAGIGHANITPDADGVVRTLPAAVEGPDGELLPSLALAAVARLDAAPLPLTLRPNGVQIGNRLVPTTKGGLLDINFTDALVPDAERRHYLSVAPFLPGGVPTPSLEGKIVLIGLVDPSLGDQHLTPTSKQQGSPGVFVHANALNTLLTNTYLKPASSTETLAWVFGLALLTAAAVLSRVLVLAVGPALFLGAYVFVAFARFDRGDVMDLVYPVLAVLVAWVGSLGVRYAAEIRQRRRLATVLAQYVPASVVRQLVGQHRRDLPQGTVTFLFTDVVGSTRAWESWPQAMSQAMQTHDALIEESVESAGGALVRPRGEGDSRFGVFVQPADGASAATEIVRRLEAEPWPTPEPIRVRIAVHVGEGELREGDYYGSPVNRCARIRSLAGPGQILVSEAMADAIRHDLPKGAELRDLGMKTLKDIVGHEHIFELAVLDRYTAPT